jgi:hypothetical protein
MSGIWDMRKEQLVTVLEDADQDASASTGEAAVSVGPQTSDSIKYSQVMTSPDEHEERPGRSLVTRNHEVIRRWAQERGSVPATVPGTERGDHLGVLRFNFPGYGGDDLKR